MSRPTSDAARRTSGDTDAHHARASHVFVVGLPRTGTHLMRDVLRDSGHVGFGPESRFMGGSRRFGVYTRPGLEHYFRRRGGALTTAEARTMLEEIFDPDTQGVWRDVCWQQLAAKQDPAAFTEQFLRSRRRAQDLFDLALQGHADGLIPGDKTPANLWHVDRLLRWFPQARVVHMVRDPRATYASMMRKGWLGPQRLRLPDVALLRLGIGGVTAVDLARAWRRAMRLDTTYRERYPSRYTFCRFEDLLTDPEPNVRRIAGFVGVPFTPAMLDRSVITSSYMPRGTPGFRTEAVEAWREHLDPSLGRWLSRLTRHELVEHGYPAR